MTCEWIVPEGDGVVVISAVVDRGLEIDEVAEDNNQAEIIVTIEEEIKQQPVSSGLQMSSTAMTTLAIASIIAIIGLFAFLAPSKIRKIE